MLIPENAPAYSLHHRTVALYQSDKRRLFPAFHEAINQDCITLALNHRLTNPPSERVTP